MAEEWAQRWFHQGVDVTVEPRRIKNNGVVKGGSEKVGVV